MLHKSNHVGQANSSLSVTGFQCILESHRKSQKGHFLSCKVMDNDCGHEKSWKVMKFKQ